MSRDRRNANVAAILFFTAFSAIACFAQTDPAIPHLTRTGGTSRLIVDGKPLTLLTGELRNSSSSSLEYMKPIWPKLAAMNLNSVIASLSWELTEPEEGHYDFALLDGLITAAREHQLRLVLIWFGTYKNATSSYAPPWVLSDLKRFPRAQTKAGVDSYTISPLGEAALAADARAYAAVMRHLKETDAHHTVVMMQVENESGFLGASRDHSPAAEQAFAAPVPAELLSYLADHKDTLRPELAAAWHDAGAKTSGNWSEIFGSMADEAFMAWHVGRFIGKVTEAGKAEYPLPMYANAWLVQYPEEPAGNYPSGGAVSRVHDIWHAAAPALDLLAPDIYLADWLSVLTDYGSRGNPLFVPESRRDNQAAQRAWSAIFQHDAIGFGPFGIDSMEGSDAELLSAGYRTMAAIQPLFEQYRGTDRLKQLMFRPGQPEQEFDFAGLHFRVAPKFPRATQTPDDPTTGSAAVGMLIAPDDDHLLIAGYGITVTPSPATKKLSFWKTDEGTFKDAQWIPGRRLNGDEEPIYLSKPGILRITLFP